MNKLSEKSHHNSQETSPKQKGKALRVCCVIFFFISVICFMGGALYWLRKNQEHQSVTKSSVIIATPAELEKGLQCSIKDRVIYSFWPEYHVARQDQADLLKECLAVAQAYLNAMDVAYERPVSEEQRANARVAMSNQVWDSINILPLIVRHYAYNKTEPNIRTRKTKGVKKFTLVEVEGKPCLQLLLAFENEPDMEFCFFKDRKTNTWKLDWQQYARYQSCNWEDFARGVGEDIGEFRLWMERDYGSETRDDYAFRLIAPGRNATSDVRIATPTVKIPKKSQIGKRLFLLHKLNAEMQASPYRILNENDESGRLRVRLILARTASLEKEGEYSFTPIKLIGPGWFYTPVTQ